MIKQVEEYFKGKINTQYYRLDGWLVIKSDNRQWIQISNISDIKQVSNELKITMNSGEYHILKFKNEKELNFHVSMILKAR